MQRELKFKVWHIGKQSFLTGWFMTEEGRIFHNFIDVTDQVIVSQYTGKKDINNEEIYENDLLQDGENFIWEVKYVEDSFCVECSEVIELMGLMEVDGDSKIIGNNYQNSKLVNN